VGSAHTRKLFEKSLIKNFIKNRENRAIFGQILFSQNALAHFIKFLPRFFQKASGSLRFHPAKLAMQSIGPPGL